MYWESKSTKRVPSIVVRFISFISRRFTEWQPVLTHRLTKKNWIIFKSKRDSLAQIFHELQSRDRGDGCDTGQPQGVGFEAYLNSTSQGELVLSVAEGTPEDARLPARRAYSSERRTARYTVAAGNS
jgi:hypothetical protein